MKHGSPRPTARTWSSSWALVCEQQVTELLPDGLEDDLVPGQLAEKRTEAPGGQVGIPGAEDAQLRQLVLIIEVEQRVPDHLKQVLDGECQLRGGLQFQEQP